MKLLPVLMSLCGNLFCFVIFAQVSVLRSMRIQLQVDLLIVTSLFRMVRLNIVLDSLDRSILSLAAICSSVLIGLLSV